ncbi:MAG: TonB family protein [Acidobacteria bacterium]|nr:TonB family protein [Acidobacteriota bacterium]
MIARAEMLANAQVAEPQSSSDSKGMAVALIGPNDAHRQTVAKALASAEGRKVHEFIDYPATLNDLARMMETKFDVVLVDVDTDESYALQIISKLSELGPAVMAYSARTDEDLLKSCMRAGARDFLPLPADGGSTATTSSFASTPAPVAPKPTPRQAAPQPTAKPTSAAVPIPTRSNVTPIIPERHVEPVVEPKASVPPRAQALPDILKETGMIAPAAQPKPEAAAEESEFAAWDAANLRRASMPEIPKPDTRPRPSLVQEKRKAPEPVRALPKVEEPQPEPVAEVAPTPIAQPIERPPVAVDIFRSSMFHAEQSEAAEKQGASLMKWVLIAAGPVVLALVLLVVFTRSSTPTLAGSSAKKAQPAPMPESTTVSKPDPTANDRLIVNATGKTGSNSQPSPGPNTEQPQAQVASAVQETEDPIPVSPDAMAAQLVAPTRIAGQIKHTAPVEEPPPSAPSSVSLDDNNSVPGSVFGASAKAKVVPHVVAISAGVAAGMIVHKTAPAYPKFAQDAHITGTVVLKATITKQGSIEGIQVLSGPKLLAPSAVDAVKTWKYKPYMLDGQPVAVETNVTVVFGGKQ